MELHVALSSDENYVPFLGTTLVSLLENNTEFKKITIHLLSNGISTKNQNELKKLVNFYKRECVIYDMSNIKELLGDLKVETIALSAYSRLFLSEILPLDIHKILYLDSDSLVLDSYKELWNLSIDDFLVAGVEDMVAGHFKTSINIPIKTKYINSGMMLMNIKRIRDENWLQKIKEFISGFNDEIPHHDQGVINALFYKKTLILHPKYNCMTPFFLMKSEELIQIYKLESYYNNTELEEAIKSPVFVHFTESFITRPWVKKSKHPLSKKYLEYLNKTPWKGFNLKEDNRILNVKIASFLFNAFPFKVFYSILKLLKVK